MQIPRPKLSYANTIATIALFVALGGAAVAAGLPKNSVGTNQLKRNAVTATKLKANAVTSAKIAGGAVGVGKIGPGAVTAGTLGTGAVSSDNVVDGAVSTEKLADGSVIASKIKNGAVTTNKLDGGSVTTGKLEGGAVTAAKIADGAVGTPELADESVTAAKLAKSLLPLPTLPPELLPSGQTERGTFMLGGDTTVDRDAISYPIPLTSTAEAKILEIGTSTPECPGHFTDAGRVKVEASPGYLCIYVALTQGSSPQLHLKYGETNLGAGLEATFGSAAPENTIFGFWTVTQGP